MSRTEYGAVGHRIPKGQCAFCGGQHPSTVHRGSGKASQFIGGGRGTRGGNPLAGKKVGLSGFGRKLQ